MSSVRCLASLGKQTRLPYEGPGNNEHDGVNDRLRQERRTGRERQENARCQSNEECGENNELGPHFIYFNLG